MTIRIIKQQEIIIGPLAWEEAKKVSGLRVNTNKKDVKVEGDQKVALESLIRRYSKLFGRASEEVCKDAVRDLVSDLPAQEVPAALR